MKALSKPNLPSKTRILFPQRGKRFFSLGLALRLRRNPARFGLRDIFSDKFGLLLDFKLAKERNFPEARLEERAGMVSRPQSGRASDESQRANTLGERAVAKGNSFPCRCSMGFTMIEILVVISIMILLSSLLILYSRTGENQIILFRDQSRLITSLNMAKSLSIQRFNASSPSCAFGVHFSKTENAFLIFRDLAADCQNADHVYTDSGELLKIINYLPELNLEKQP